MILPFCYLPIFYVNFFFFDMCTQEGSDNSLKMHTFSIKISIIILRFIIILAFYI
jgi:hypothetical protein